ncbi:MAG: hypothetical protein ACTSYS_00105 [Promethearchaeota archaeon]
MKIKLEDNIKVYKIPEKNINFLSNIFKLFKTSLSKEHKSTPLLLFFEKMAKLLTKIFGLLIIDNKESLINLPFPIDTPLALISTLKGVVSMHTIGFQEIIETCK